MEWFWRFDIMLEKVTDLHEILQEIHNARHQQYAMLQGYKQ